MTDRRSLARQLTSSLLAGPWTPVALRLRSAQALPSGLPDPRVLVDRLLQHYPEQHAPPPRQLEQTILDDPAFQRACCSPDQHPLQIARLLSSPVMELPVDGLQTGPLPPLSTHRDLMHWLAVGAGELEWLADCEERNVHLPDGPLTHYRYLWKPRSNGCPRLIEIPKPRLKRIQRKILDQILNAIEPHPAAHGFRAGRSTLTYAAPHTHQAAVARFDLEDFFPSIDSKQIIALFRSIGYPYRVARTFTGLCSHSVAGAALVGPNKMEWQRRKRLMAPHLPQGAPTSPAIANLCAYRLDCRLAGLARSIGLNYTRYADDLAFSGGEGLTRGFERFHVLVARIALEGGFALNTHKTALMKRATRQQLTGIVLNQGNNIPRDAYDLLKATLYNCVRDGPASQNRDGHADFRAHLLGRIANTHAINPARAERLRRLFDRIDWEDHALQARRETTNRVHWPR